MIAGCTDVKVIKFCIHCNEVDTNTYDWLPIIYQTTEVGLCYFALDTERGDFFLAWEQESRRRKERKETSQAFSLSASHTGSHVLVCMCWDGEQRMCSGDGGVGG